MISTILAFSQVFLVSFSKSEPCLLDNRGFCNPDHAYIQSYSILLGSFNLLDFPNPFSKFLFVSFSVIVSIVLFNVLIGMTVQSYSNTMKNAKSMGSNTSRLSYVTDIRAFRRLFTTRWTLLKILSLGLFILCSAFLFYASNSNSRSLIIKAFDIQILWAIIIALTSIALLSCIVFLGQISFIEPWEETIADQKDDLIHRCVHTLLYPFRFLVLILVDMSADPQSWFKDFCQLNGGSMNNVETVKDEMSKMHQTTMEKMDRLYDMLAALQAKEYKLQSS